MSNNQTIVQQISYALSIGFRAAFRPLYLRLNMDWCQFDVEDDEYRATNANIDNNINDIMWLCLAKEWFLLKIR